MEREPLDELNCLFEEYGDNIIYIPWRINLTEPLTQKEDGTWDGEDSIITIDSYMKDLGAEVLVSTLGYHTEGKKKKPHLHYALICKKFDLPNYTSVHRDRWCKKINKNEGAEHTLKGSTWLPCYYAQMEYPLYKPLAYPFKEGKVVSTYRGGNTFRGKKMRINMINFLKELGSRIYQQTLAENEIRDAYEERKNLAYQKMDEFLGEKKFENFREMLIYLEEEYLGKEIEFSKIPTSSNYREMCFKLGKKRGIFNYYSLFH